jgi:EAL domain-containing protein (putative c-di-GMP-specific phosphodiesterase class I)
MYQAKDAGGGRVGVFSAQLHHVATTRLELETSLVRAIEQDELVLHYQPIVDAKTGHTCGAEALVRWNHPERGLVPPGEFIPVAELSDLIVRLGDWVIREACHEAARWADLGLEGHFVTVNISSRHFRTDLVSTVAAALREHGVDPSMLVIELTESTAVEDVGLVADRLRELRQIGVKAAIDDFGTGYCGLQYLGDLPVSTLKLDRSFVQAMTPRSAAIVAATIAMTRSLGMTLVAEGVENADQRRFLESQGCDRMQGYHLGRPMPGDEFVDRIRAEIAAPPAPPEIEEPPVPRLRAVQASGGG